MIRRAPRRVAIPVRMPVSAWEAVARRCRLCWRGVSKPVNDLNGVKSVREGVPKEKPPAPAVGCGGAVCHHLRRATTEECYLMRMRLFRGDMIGERVSDGR